MMFRNISVALSALGMAILMSPGAHAAVMVLGNSTGQSCYEAAEFGSDTRTDTKDGIAACTEALDQVALPRKDRAATLVNRGILYSRDDNPEAAIADYDKGLAINASLAEGYVDRGAALIVLKRYDEALQAINKGIELGSNRLQIAYYDRAIVQEALGNVRAAYEDYKMAVQIEPDFALATAQLSRFKVVRRHTDGT
jgi:tetratricopeptide (TPR) repeat protein